MLCEEAPESVLVDDMYVGAATKVVTSAMLC